ncbi:MAG: FprA family A-type flavoprotein [Anaerolineae bacterium]|nr:FprA family A-type flavoprotein [Anaerolineae bacterium]
MPPVQVKPDIYWIGVNDRTTDLFEGLWPITQEGVSYNTYLIDDEHKAIIDLAKAIKTDEFFGQIEQLIDLTQLEYVIINHLEPDHTGVIRTVRRVAPDVTFVCSKRCQDMLAAFYGITDHVRPVGDGDTLTLGAHTLQFYMAPMVHWPETMVTYETRNQILFSCDAFGGYGALRGALFDDECGNLAWYEREALRYYVNIVALFSRPVLRAIDKLSALPIATIAPSHGLIWRRDPSRIVSLYKEWAEYATGPTQPGVTLLYGSMYGNTEAMMNAVAQGISDQGVPIEIFDVAHTHVSYVLPALWTQRGVMVGAPTYEGSLFPLVDQALQMASHKKIQNKLAARFGSYGWSGGAGRRFGQLVEELKWELFGEFEFVGAATQADFEAGRDFGARFARAVRGNID